MTRSTADETMYAETPQGLFTASGVWFQTSEEAVRAYAGPVLEREPLPRLLARAERWLRSAQTLALWFVPVLLLVLPPLAAVLVAALVWFSWRVLSPLATSRAADRVLRLLEPVWAQGVVYFIVLGYLGNQGALAAVGAGLAAFVLLRWNVLDRLARPLLERVWAAVLPLPAPDQVLRSVIVRAAVAHGASLPEVDRMEHQLIEFASRRRA